MSRKEVRFIEMMELQDGHYNLRLPLVTMSNNCCVFQQRLIGIRKEVFQSGDLSGVYQGVAQCQLRLAEVSHQEYASFLWDVISDSYTQMVPWDVLGCGEDSVFFISHYGVHHTHKDKL